MVHGRQRKSGRRPVELKTQTMASQIPDQRIYFRRLVIRGINTTSTAGITSAARVNGTAADPYTSNPIGAGDFDVFAPIVRKGLRADSTISGSGIVEIQGVSYEIEPMPAGVPSVIA